ncbi:DUF2892 domain-containing protein [Campylobacter corcagiensis]|uniref:DUF2892 domain-containing protein n=1 Tax=Campylobacter corcagiensis TaxID=1448857 RepID=A0A7M1LJA1_9BACT|nr:DUF2892 domain-containing protein [Campylobacter corcagiensis]QKF65522.1 DUF2892 domain-containing membrane protein [Campylobacter corcagiensis]QOQ87906.1 DUF2892 domain-containing protein [Campylobacter corcagiensis]
MSRENRIIRIALGLIFMIVVGIMFMSWWALLGLIPVIVGITGFCPACYFLNRCSTKR